MPSDWQIGDRIQDRWEIHKILPPGGMGIVYVVYDHHFQAPAALKTFKAEALGRDPDVAYHFHQEALAWIDLGRHENITRARSVETINRKVFLCLEYVSGGDLGNWIGKPRLTEDLPQVLRFAIQFCDGMIYARSRGIQVHRDIKPQNCLITRDLTLKVTDFGLAKIFDGTQEAGRGPSAQREAEAPNIAILSIGVTRTGTAAGTCTHMAPEQFDDAKHVDVRADIYSFGIMLYQMITGRVPFRGRTWEELERQHRTQPPPLVPGDPSLAAVVATCLAKQPAVRFPDFTSLRTRLATIFEATTAEPAPQPVAESRRDSNDWHRKADALAELGYREEAVASYDRALELNPRYEQAWFNKAVVLAYGRRYEEALACYDRALELNPRNEIGWSHKATVLGKLGRHEQKVACCDRALELNPRYEEARFSKGVALANLGRYEEALACYDEVNELDEGCRFDQRGIYVRDSHAWFNKGIILTKVGRHQEALACFDRLSTAFAWREKLAVLKELGRHEETSAFDAWVSDYRPSDYRRSEFELVEIPPASDKLPTVPSERSSPIFSEAAWDRIKKGAQWALAVDYHCKGVALANSGRHAEALTCYELVLEINPRDAEAWCGKGFVLHNLGRHAEALTCYERALEINPRLAEAWFKKGIALANSGRHAEALTCYGRALEINPRLAEVWSNKGVTLGDLGRHDEALTSYERALEINPRLAEAWLNKGTVLAYLGSPVEALTCYERALEIKPRYAEAWLNKGTALLRLRRPHEALTLYERALEIDPGDAKAWYGKGFALAELGRHDEALTCYDRALELNPRDAKAWYSKGVALHNTGRFEQALACFEQAQQLGYPQAAEAIAVCRGRLRT